MKTVSEIQEMLDRLEQAIEDGGDYRTLNGYQDALQWVTEEADEDLITGE